MMAPPDSALLIYVTWGFAVLVLAGVLSWSYFRMQGQMVALAQRIDQLQGEVHSLQRVLRHVHDDGHQTRRLEAELEERVALLSRQQEQLMLRDADTGPYFQAIRQAQQGANLDELLERTGISRGEAELILALHGGSPDDTAQ